MQFGTNDSNQTATYDDGEPYYLAPATDFKTWMQMYIDGAKGRGVTPVLVTPPPRNSCRSDGVSFNYSFTSYATAMKELGQTNSVAVVDLGARAVTYLNGKADCDWASANFFLVRADGTVDGTHFQETGANILAGLVVEGIGALRLPLASFMRSSCELPGFRLNVRTPVEICEVYFCVVTSTGWSDAVPPRRACCLLIAGVLAFAGACNGKIGIRRRRRRIQRDTHARRTGEPPLRGAHTRRPPRCPRAPGG